jgi:arsenite methyltransferase
MMDEKMIKETVKKRYAKVASRGGDCCGSEQVSCCGDIQEIVSLVDYSSLEQLPVEGSDLGLGCGIPTRDAGILPGQTVLDLGSGAGVDVFLAAQAVGEQGQVIGVDMTPEMIARAWNNAAKGGFQNVDFRLGEIENLPVTSDSVDVLLSNCVINLVPDKRRAFAEIYRVLKPGGHFSISDVVTYGQVPPEVRQDMELWAGCLAGALDQEDYLQIIRQAGFENVQVKDTVKFDMQKGETYGTASITVEGYKA